MNEDRTSDLNNAVVLSADGVVVRVHVQPKSRRDQIVGMHGDRIKLAVTAPPDKGKANDAVVRLIAAALKFSPSRVEILRGDISRQKDLLVRNLNLADVRALLAAVMSE
jgi:uncharacterized protein (TIGR00251 family)